MEFLRKGGPGACHLCKICEGFPYGFFKLRFESSFLAIQFPRGKKFKLSNDFADP